MSISSLNRIELKDISFWDLAAGKRSVLLSPSMKVTVDNILIAYGDPSRIADPVSDKFPDLIGMFSYEGFDYNQTRLAFATAVQDLGIDGAKKFLASCLILFFLRGNNLSNLSGKSSQEAEEFGKRLLSIGFSTSVRNDKSAVTLSRIALAFPSASISILAQIERQNQGEYVRKTELLQNFHSWFHHPSVLVASLPERIFNPSLIVLQLCFLLQTRTLSRDKKSKPDCLQISNYANNAFKSPALSITERDALFSLMQDIYMKEIGKISMFLLTKKDDLIDTLGFAMEEFNSVSYDRAKTLEEQLSVLDKIKCVQTYKTAVSTNT